MAVRLVARLGEEGGDGKKSMMAEQSSVYFKSIEAGSDGGGVTGRTFLLWQGRVELRGRGMISEREGNAMTNVGLVGVVGGVGRESSGRSGLLLEDEGFRDE